MKTFINQEYSLLPDCAFGPDVRCENCMSGLSAMVLNLSKSVNILFRCQMEIACSVVSSASLSLEGDNSMVHELRVITAVKLNVR